MSEPQTTLTDGSPVTPDHREIDPKTGMQKGYVVLSEAERAKGFVRPVRTAYVHVGPRGPQYPLRDVTEAERIEYEKFGYIKYEAYPEGQSAVVGRWWTQKALDEVGKGCGEKTTMSLPLAETWARDPRFYGGTFCATCGQHYPRDHFVWAGTEERLGSDLETGPDPIPTAALAPVAAAPAAAASSPRQLTTHKVNGLNDAILIGVLDPPGPGGVNHVYQVALARGKTGPAGGAGDLTIAETLCTIRFQNGPVQEVGFNGLSNEALLAIVIDRLEGFQRGPFANDHNAYALDAIKDAMSTLHRRTQDRMSRGVEGTHKP